MKKQYVLSLDQGTTGTTALLIDAKTLTIVGSTNKEFKQYFPKPSYVEHDLNEIWKSVEISVCELLKKTKISSRQIIGIGITNQRETTCAFNKKGIPLSKAIVWQDRRTLPFCDKNKNAYKKFIEKTGLPLDPYFSATKMNWLLSNNPKIKKEASKNTLKFGTIDTFLVYKLTSGKSFVTEPTNASRTLLMNLKNTSWDMDLLSFFKIKKDWLPEIKESFSHFGKTEGLNFLPDGIPILSILGDQQSALFGQACFYEGESKCTYGTGAFILLNTGTKITYSKKGLLTTVAYKYKNKTYYALEGSTYIAGAAVQFVRDNFKFIKKSSEIEALASRVKDLDKTKNLFFFPFLTGLGSPYWKSEARGAITGLTRGTTIEEILRVTLEGIALSVNDSLTAFLSDSKRKMKSIRVDGGASLNNLLMDLQANFSNIEIIRPSNIETTGFGTGLGVLLMLNLTTLDKIKKTIKINKRFKPSSKNSYFNYKKEVWTNYIKSNFMN